MGVTVSSITDHLRALAPQVVVDAVERKSKLFNFFGPMQPVDGGPGPEWRVNYSGNSSASSFGDSDPEPVAGAQSFIKAYLAWKYSWVILRLSRAAIEQAGSNASLIGELVANEVNGGTLDLINDLEAQIMSDGTGNSNKDITGIQSAIKASGTYAAIDRSTYTWWQSSVTGTVGTLDESDVQTVTADLRSSTRKGSPTHMLCGPTVFNIFGNLLEGTPVYNRPLDPPAAGGPVLVGGFRAINWEGMEVLEIPGYTAQRLDIIQRDDWSIKRIRDFVTDPFEIDGDDLTTKVTVGLQLKCAHSGRQGALTGITG